MERIFCLRFADDEIAHTPRFPIGEKMKSEILHLILISTKQHQWHLTPLIPIATVRGNVLRR